MMFTFCAGVSHSWGDFQLVLWTDNPNCLPQLPGRVREPVQTVEMDLPGEMVVFLVVLGPGAAAELTNKISCLDRS